MFGRSVVAWCVLNMTAAVTGPADERVYAPRAAATLARSNRTLGSFRLQFKTRVPLPRKDGVVGTLQFDRSQAGLVHRILMDTQRGLYYGYDIHLSKTDVAGRFGVAVKPLDSSVDREFRERLWGDFCQSCDAPRSVAHITQRYPEPQVVVAPGDTVTVDLLADEKSGELISEEITLAVLDRGPRPIEVLPASDLKADDVWLQMAEAELFVNGQPVGEPKGPSVQGEVVWVQLPDRGRAFLSLAPRGGYDFKKIGVASGNKITFTIEGERYEWVSESPIVTAGPVPPFNNVQSWHVWVLHDRDFQPSANAQGGMGAGLDERAKNRLKRP